MTKVRKREAAPRGRRGAAPTKARAGVRASRDVISRRLGDEVILVNLETDRVYALNETAARFWELLSSRRSLSSIERQLAAEFEVDGSKLGRDLARLLSALESKKLIARD